MYNLKKIVGITILSVSMLGLAACSLSANQDSDQTDNPSQNVEASEDGNNEGIQAENDTNPEAAEDDINDVEHTDAENINNADSRDSADSNDSEKVEETDETAPQTQQEAFKQIAVALDSKVPFMLPTEIPASEEMYLSAKVQSEKWYYSVEFVETAEPTKINDPAVSEGRTLATIEGTEYSNASSAKQQINGYIKVDPPKEMSLDLGKGITAQQEGAAGHSYISWNEGRWTITVDSPLDSAYQNKSYPDDKELSEKIVAYLHDHALPAPQEIGVITIHNWNKWPKTTVEWQHHEMIYKVTSRDPLLAIKTAVTMKLASESQ